MATPISGSPSPPPPMPPPAPPSNVPSTIPPRRRTWVYVVASIVVAGVIVLLALVVVGVGPFAPSNNGNGNAPSFSAAVGIAQRTAASYAAGPWSTLLAAAVVFGANFSTEVNSTSVLGSIPASECIVTPTSDFPTSISQNAVTFNRSSGGAPIWVFLLRNVNGSGLVVWVHNGVGQPLVTLSGGICSAGLALLPALPNGIVDSSVAVSAALNDGGYAFLKAHPNANLTMSVHGPITLSLTSSIPGNWSVTLETCALTSSSTAPTNGAVFNAQVGITSGKVLATPTVNQTSCSTSAGLPGGLSGTQPGGPSNTIPIGTALAFGSFEAASVGSGADSGYYENGTVADAAPGLDWSNLSFLVTTASGGVAAGPLNLVVTAPSGCTVAIYSLAADTFETVSASIACSTLAFPGATPVVAGQELHEFSTSSLVGLGDSLEVFGGPPYGGSLTIAFP